MECIEMASLMTMSLMWEMSMKQQVLLPKAKTDSIWIPSEDSIRIFSEETLKYKCTVKQLIRNAGPRVNEIISDEKEIAVAKVKPTKAKNKCLLLITGDVGWWKVNSLPFVPKSRRISLVLDLYNSFFTSIWRGYTLSLLRKVSCNTLKEN